MRLFIFWSERPLRLMFLAGLLACEALAAT